MKYVYKGILFLALAWLGISLGRRNVKAADLEENVSVTVSSQISIVFEENGTNSVSDFAIENHSPVPIHITNVMATAYNDWKLVSGEQYIPADAKQLSFCFQGQYLSAGDNLLQLTVPENSVQRPSIQIRRGAFSGSRPSEKALELSIEYALGQKGFSLTFEGAEESTEQVTVYNGETIKLPVPWRMKYNFLGWEDEKGNLYQDVFLMPMRDVVLTAKWQWTEAYVIYTEADQTLRFVRSVEPLVAGDFWDGKEIQTVYTGVENEGFVTKSGPPWLWCHVIKRIEVLDWIQPASTAYWFYDMFEVEYMDLRKLEMSQVTSMVAMFSATGLEVAEKVTVLGMGDWDVSSVKNFGSMFRQFGKNAKVVEMGDISGWDTSSAEDMVQLFLAAFQQSDVVVDCSKWNVDKVTRHSQFKQNAGGTIIEPNWSS